MPDIVIQKSFRKTLSMRFDKNGILQIKAPVFSTNYQIQKFIEKNKNWIDSQQEQKKKSLFKAEKIPEYKALAKQVIPPRVSQLAKQYGFSYNAVRITSARTRWGSCSSKKNLNFTYRLALAPPEVRDYVIVHELCHLREMNHSKRFWSEVYSIMPNYKEHEKWLKQNGASIS